MKKLHKLYLSAFLSSLFLLGAGHQAFAATAPTKPTGLAVSSVTQTSAVLSWSPVSGATSYVVTENGKVVKTLGTTSSTTISGLTPNNYYSFFVVAKNSSGSSLPATTSAKTTAIPVPTAPTGLTVGTNSQTYTSLRWNLETWATSYDIYQNGTPIAEVTGNSYTVTNLTPNTSYSYTVVANNPTGTSSQSASLTQATLQIPVPAAPTASISGATTTGFTIKWSPVQWATSYTLKDQSGAVLSSNGNTSYTVTNKMSNTTYTYTLYATDAVGNSKVVTINAKTLALAAPTGLKATSTTYNSINMSWNAVTNATSYTIYRNGVQIGTSSSPSYSDSNLNINTIYSYSVTATTPIGETLKGVASLKTANFTADTSGLTQGVSASTGSANESWNSNGGSITMNALAYTPTDNLLPISGKVNTSFRNDIIAQIYNTTTKQSWIYTIPVNADGTFSYTITIPFTGSNQVMVAIPSYSNGSGFGATSGSPYLIFANKMPSLTINQLGLLESWMANYKDSSSILTQAQSIVSGQTTKDGQIKAVSDWVSQHIYYNFPEENNGMIAWQQATQTLSIGNGVCQDETAVTASFLRSLGIPTLIVDGTAKDPTTYAVLGPHSWLEAYDGTKWIYFDPTWDQVYTSTSSIAPPSSITSTWFNVNPTTFSVSHVPNNNNVNNVAYQW